MEIFPESLKKEPEDWLYLTLSPGTNKKFEISLFALLNCSRAQGVLAQPEIFCVGFVRLLVLLCSLLRCVACIAIALLCVLSYTVLRCAVPTEIVLC